MVHTRNGAVAADLAIAYGWVHAPMFERYRAAGARYVFLDLGYFGRRPSHAADEGYHRFAMDDWDTAKHMIRNMPGDRLSRHNLPLRSLDRPRGDTIIIAGMSEKAARTHGHGFGQWENRMKMLLEHLAPDRTIIDRPKPSGKSPVKSLPIEQLLDDAHMLVTHHSNAAIDALIAGVPTYALKGAGALISPRQLSAAVIEHPEMPTEESRMSLLNDIAYAQWTPAEMRRGDFWEFLKGQYL
jgi:hypothetical protein